MVKKIAFIGKSPGKRSIEPLKLSIEQMKMRMEYRRQRNKEIDKAWKKCKPFIQKGLKMCLQIVSMLLFVIMAAILGGSTIFLIYYLNKPLGLVYAYFASHVITAILSKYLLKSLLNFILISSGICLLIN